MDKRQILEKLKELTQKEISLSQISDALNINNYEILGYVGELNSEGINIIRQKKEDDIYLFNHGERDFHQNPTYKFDTDQNNEFKFMVISDTRFGSKQQQLSLLNDSYQTAYDLGCYNVFLCGNISEGVYPMSNPYAEECFINDTIGQVDYITRNYPQIDGMKTYFITGPKDETHLKRNKLNIGKRISENRDDMVYLGQGSVKINIDNINLLIFNSKSAKTYTVSYRMQQQVNSFRSEDKPDILLYGGLLQMEKFTHRDVQCLSIPSLCSTTKEMREKRQDNTVGARFITVTSDNYGNLLSCRSKDSIYYKTIDNDYLKPKVLKLERK